MSLRDDVDDIFISTEIVIIIVVMIVTPFKKIIIGPRMLRLD